MRRPRMYDSFAVSDEETVNAIAAAARFGADAVRRIASSRGRGRAPPIIHDEGR